MTVAQGIAARATVTAMGGLYMQSALAKRLGVSQVWMSELVRRPNFPEPVILNEGVPGAEKKAWWLEEVLDFQRERGVQS